MITMLPEIGLFALILALCCAFVQCVLPAIGVTTGRQHFMALAGPATSVQWLFTVISNCVLTISFPRDDFSVTYVAMTSNTLTPLLYKITGVWGGHEGSLLLWALVLASWSLAVATIGKHLPLILRARVLSVFCLLYTSPSPRD